MSDMDPSSTSTSSSPRTPQPASRRLERAMHRSLYLALQRLRGRPVGAAMKQLTEWDALDADSFERLCRERLAAMLLYARDRVPLYRSGKWQTALQGRDGGALEHWPLLERDVLRERGAELRADDPSRFTVNRRSSASTGAPVTVAWNPDALARSWAAEYQPMLWHGLTLGCRTLRIWGSGRPFENWALNRHFVPAHELSPDRLDAAVQYLETHRPDVVWGSPSSVTELARHVGRLRGEAATPLVPFAKVGGEQVYRFQRDEIRRYLGARVIEAYGCTEVGPVAAECPRGSMHVLGANVHVEIFRDGVPVPPGETGDIVATTLINRAMPLIRCRIGDLGRISPDPCDCGLPHPVLSELRGRARDLLIKTDGTAVHSSVLGAALGRYVGRAPLGHAQKILFQQLDRRTWKVQIEAPQCRDTATLDAQVAELVRDTFGQEARSTTEVVTRIPREASGKFRYYRAGSTGAADAGADAVLPIGLGPDDDGSEDDELDDTARLHASLQAPRRRGAGVTDARPPSGV